VGHFTDVTLSLSKGLIILRCPTARIRAAKPAAAGWVPGLYFSRNISKENKDLEPTAGRLRPLRSGAPRACRRFFSIFGAPGLALGFSFISPPD
jgi:hypothetical protein